MKATSQSSLTIITLTLILAATAACNYSSPPPAAANTSQVVVPPNEPVSVSGLPTATPTPVTEVPPSSGGDGERQMEQADAAATAGSDAGRQAAAAVEKEVGNRSILCASESTYSYPTFGPASSTPSNQKPLEQRYWRAYQALMFNPSAQALNEADRLNGVTWKGQVFIMSRAYRIYTPPFRGPVGTWSQWLPIRNNFGQGPDGVVTRVGVQQVNGKLQVRWNDLNEHFSVGVGKIDCEKIPGANDSAWED